MGDANPAEPVDIVLHIGSSKTGTTTLQRVLRRNPEALRAAGHLYPRTPGKIRHTKLGLFVQPDDELARHPDWIRHDYGTIAGFRRNFRGRIAREIGRSDAHRVVLSDEGLFAASDRTIQRMRRFTRRIGREVRLVVYLRRQDDHLVSRYQQVVKTGEIEPMATWLNRDWSGFYDYHQRLQAWQELSPAALVVRRFERERMVGGSLVSDFLAAAAIDVSEAELTHTEPRNESLGAEATELLRILNIHQVEHQGQQPGLFGNQHHVVRLQELPNSPVLSLPASDLDRFMAQWEGSNRRVAREFLDDSSGELFLADRKSSGTTTEQRLDPARLDHYLEVLEIPKAEHDAIRRIAEREAAGRHFARPRARR